MLVPSCLAGARSPSPIRYNHIARIPVLPSAGEQVKSPAEGGILEKSLVQEFITEAAHTTLSRTDHNLLQEAKQILTANWCGSYTKPSPRLYPHQWNWDSGFIAIGYSYFDQEKAFQELRSLFDAQWKTGMVPHIVFNPEVGGYFPGPDFWDSGRSPDSPQDRQTSGLTMPPVHAIAALAIYVNGTKGMGRDFLSLMFPRIKALHRYLYQYRDPLREGLVYIRHPWESGTDNSPAWDEPFQAIDLNSIVVPPYTRTDLTVIASEHRPTKEDYDRYVYLVECAKKERYDERSIAQGFPFLIQDPLFNSILCKANEDLMEIASVLQEDIQELKEWHDQTRSAIDAKLWDEEAQLYTYYDLNAKKQLSAGAHSGFGPLFGGVPSAARARQLVRQLTSPRFNGAEGRYYLVPSFDATSSAFNPVKYWRGPVWINVNWMIYRGLQRYGFETEAAAVRHDCLELLRRYGFYEYFNPDKMLPASELGGYGTDQFSWSAALCLDFLHESQSTPVDNDGAIR